MTDLERQAKSIFAEVLEHYTSGKRVSPWQFQEHVGRVRDIYNALKNKEFGCATGKHTGVCQCKQTTGHTG